MTVLLCAGSFGHPFLRPNSTRWYPFLSFLAAAPALASGETSAKSGLDLQLPLLSVETLLKDSSVPPTAGVGGYRHLAG